MLFLLLLGAVIGQNVFGIGRYKKRGVEWGGRVPRSQINVMAGSSKDAREFGGSEEEKRKIENR